MFGILGLMERPVIPPSDTFRARFRRQTRWSDEDKQSVLNNAVYLSLLEEARLDYFRELDLMIEGEFPFVLAQTNIRFAAPGRGGAWVEIELRTTDLGRSSFTQLYRVVEVETGTVLVEAEAVLVCWNRERRGKTDMTPEFRRRVAAFEGL